MRGQDIFKRCSCLRCCGIPENFCRAVSSPLFLSLVIVLTCQEHTTRNTPHDMAERTGYYRAKCHFLGYIRGNPQDLRGNIAPYKCSTQAGRIYHSRRQNKKTTSTRRPCGRPLTSRRKKSIHIKIKKTIAKQATHPKTRRANANRFVEIMCPAG